MTDIGFSGPRLGCLLLGASPPTPADGRDGDFFIDYATWTLYGPKRITGWPNGIVLNPANIN